MRREVTTYSQGKEVVDRAVKQRVMSDGNKRGLRNDGEGLDAPASSICIQMLTAWETLRN